MRTGLIIVAAGSGARAGGPRKQFRRLGDRAVVAWSVDAGRAAGVADPLVIVVAAGEEDALAAALGPRVPDVRVVTGGASRTASVRAGLERLAAETSPPDRVLIHDAARPLASPSLFAAVNASLDAVDAACPALPVADALKLIAADPDAIATGDATWLGDDVDRSTVRAVQTPQGFAFAPLLAAYRALPHDASLADDVAVARAAGLSVRLIAGDAANQKITMSGDHERLEALIAPPLRRVAVGHGFDAHRIVPGNAGMALCGVLIPGPLTLAGHSDADAALHALTDAILGALGDGDIGDHFPPSDPQWRGAASRLFLEHAAGLARAAGAKISHVDVTIICERPKIKPHRAAMRAALAEMLVLGPDQVSVKATTTEAMGFTGRGEGLAAQATATLAWF